jgi:hypothetical protein
MQSRLRSKLRAGAVRKLVAECQWKPACVDDRAAVATSSLFALLFVPCFQQP